MTDALFKVRLEAALSLVSLSIPDERASGMLFHVLDKGDAVQRWRAARCLASVGACTYAIAAVLLDECVHYTFSHVLHLVLHHVLSHVLHLGLRWLNEGHGCFTLRKRAS
jgi:hypothetical protein